MLLACDIGNTNIKTGVFKDDEIVEFNSFSGYPSLINYLQKNKFKHAAISSVVPELTVKLKEDISSLFNIDPFIINIFSSFKLKMNYDSIETLGADRICSVEGSFELYKKSNEFKAFNPHTFLLSVDLGTATTINIVKFPGEFIGGIIAPGINLMFESLNKKTAQLPEVDILHYKSIIGKDTNSSIASGVINSSIGLIERTIEFLKSNLQAESFKIFITGGNAEKIIPYLKFNFEYVKGLVLIGINSIYKKNFPD